MGGYRKFSVVTVIILVLLVIVIFKINALISDQLNGAGTVQKPLSVEAPKEIKKEEIKPPSKIIEGLVIEGPPPSPIVTEKLPPAPIKSNGNLKGIYEPSPDTLILVQ